MGAKTWMLVYADGEAAAILKAGPQLERAATLEPSSILFPREKLEEVGVGDLSFTCPPDNEIHIGVFPRVAIVAAREFGGDYPSRLRPGYLSAFPERTLTLHALHSAVDWLGFAVWKQGRLLRSVGLSPDTGVLENIGAELPFEQPFWAGERPAVDPEEESEGYPLPFHPLELGEEALLDFFGYQLEGPATKSRR